MTKFYEEFEEIKQAYNLPNWDGYGALPLNQTSVRLAEEFIKQAMELFPELPYPELAPEPDGDLGFDWNLNKSQLGVSISEKRKLSYAYRGLTSRGRGSIEYGERVPKVLRDYFKTILEKETSND